VTTVFLAARADADGAPQSVTMAIPPQTALQLAALQQVMAARPAPPLPTPEADLRIAARDVECLADAVYYEARGESAAGQAAVAQVVLNRVRSPAFPKTVCSVVYERAAAGACQFSFACASPGRRERQSWARARDVARRALGGYVMTAVGGATCFHVARLGDSWGPRLVRVAQVGQHVFFGRAGRPSPARAEPFATPVLDVSAAASAAGGDARVS